MKVAPSASPKIYNTVLLERVDGNFKNIDVQYSMVNGALSGNGNIPVEVPDFTRGEWNKIHGFHHAYASAADEKKAADEAAAFTLKLKEQGKKYWEKVDKAAKKK